MKNLSLLAAPLLLASAAQAQFDLPEPHESMKAFAPAIGYWEGAGDSSNPMGGDRLPWTSTSDFEYVLSGFAVREVLHVDLGIMGSYDMIALYAYSANEDKIVRYACDNFNGVSESVVQWIDNSMIIGKSGLQPDMTGTPILNVERSTTTFQEDSAELSMLNMMGTNAVDDYVTGTMKRKPRPSQAVEAGMKGEALSEAMQPLAPLVGTWKFSGTMTMAPGMDAMPIGGTDTFYPFVGGNGMVANVVGDDMDGFVYEATALMGWNAGTKCWDHFTVTNMGDVMRSQQWNGGEGKLIMTHSGSYQGMPYAERGIFEFGKDGPSKIVSDRYTGTEPGYRTFEGTYAKKTR